MRFPTTQAPTDPWPVVGLNRHPLPQGRNVSRFSLQRPQWLLFSLLLGLSLETPLSAIEDAMSSASEESGTRQATADTAVPGHGSALHPKEASADLPPAAFTPSPAETPALARTPRRSQTLEAGLRSEPLLRMAGQARAGAVEGQRRGKCGSSAGSGSTARKSGKNHKVSQGRPGRAKSTAAPRKTKPTGLLPLGASRRYAVDACQSGWMVLVGESLQTPEIIRLPARLLPEPCQEGATVQLRVFKGWTTQALSLTGQHSRLQVFGIQPPPGPEGHAWKGGKAPRQLATQTLVWCRSGQKPVLLSHRLFQTLPRPGTRLTLLAELIHEGSPVSALAALRSTLEISCPTIGPLTGNSSATGLCFWDLTLESGAVSTEQPAGEESEQPATGPIVESGTAPIGVPESPTPAPVAPTSPLVSPQRLEPAARSVPAS